MLNARAILIAVTALSSLSTWAQADGLVAYVVPHPVDRTADDMSIGLVQSALPGKTEAFLPSDADRVDILNAHGNVERSYTTNELDRVDLSELGKGTWTLRVRTPRGFMVRRFLALREGAQVWVLPEQVKKR